MERRGVPVWISWDQDDDEAYFADVPFEHLSGIESLLYSYLEQNPDYSINEVKGWLDVEVDALNGIKYVVTIYGTRS